MAARKRRGKSAYHHGDLRAALIKASRRLVRDGGAAAFSLREAARAVGVDPAACYRHFRRREDVLVAIAQEGFVDLSASFAKAVEERAGEPARDVLIVLAGIYLDFALARPAEFRLMFGESGIPSVGPPMRRSEMQESAYERLVATSARYIEAESLRSDAEHLALVLWSGTHGATRLVLDGAVPLSKEKAHALVGDVIGALLDGVG